ncbi:MAG: hypothetical protein ACN6O1_21070 [Comamonas sp.]|uniref:hypothetical protein n=1 Tax=Comamonas sp. TaxID=34028 RepID=UPI003D136D8A
MKFTFNRGQWIDGNNLLEWQEYEDLDVHLQRNGYSTVATKFGHNSDEQIEIYESDKNKSFYASVSPTGNSVFEVYLPDFPSLMMFIKDYVTPFSVASSSDYLNEILSKQQKSR